MTAGGNLAGGGITVVGLGQNNVVTMYLASAITADDVGKPVTFDTPNNTVKLSGDGDIVLGVLETYESRLQEGVKTGAVSMTGGFRFPYVTSDAVAVGDSIVAGASSKVKKTTTINRTRVFSKNTVDETVEVYFF